MSILRIILRIYLIILIIISIVLFLMLPIIISTHFKNENLNWLFFVNLPVFTALICKYCIPISERPIR